MCEESGRERQLVEAMLQIDREQADLQMLPMEDERLDAALRNGLERGRRHTVRMSRKRLSLKLGLSAACVLLLLTAFVRVSPSFAAIMKEIPGFGDFVELVEGDKTLVSALDNEFIQPMSLTDEKNGFKLTVNGVIADDNRLVILYTGEGPGITSETEIEDFKLLKDNGEGVRGVIGFSQFRGDKEGAGSVMYDYFDVSLQEGEAMPENVDLNVKLKDQWLRTNVPIDHSKFAGMREEIAVNEVIELDGQRLTVESAVITPLQVRVTVKADPDNTLQTNGMIDAVLKDEKGRIYTWKTGMGDYNDEMVYHFQSSYFAKPKQLALEADGAYMSQRDRLFVINTETGETSETPDKRITYHGKQEEKDGYILQLDMADLDETEQKLGYTFFEYNGSFTDASGKSYSLLDKDGTKIESGGSEPARYYFKIPKADYVQPLTFRVKQYPGYILEPISITIK
ncbi:DUF4179 domain-containing protein [Paenibacillus harenae]|uniref:DUF4179 domain-containing protein n=1 Tax=Paenibacillus harenae TaxID=306543 RepID=UPI0027909E89|nr:DUF4179 domain-containing protein [Paenibacillus harenae]MDQ0062096.1 hypothetical protein [Paenibacillus harenae]